MRKNQQGILGAFLIQNITYQYFIDLEKFGILPCKNQSAKPVSKALVAYLNDIKAIG